MSQLLPNFLADLNSLPWVAIIAVSGSMLIALAGIIGGLWFANRRQAMWHETARVALEKGQPLPPMPAEMSPSPEPVAARPSGDLRYGLVLIAVGAGLFLFLDSLVGRGLGLIGAIPAFIGGALLLTALLSRWFGARPPSGSDRS